MDFDDLDAEAERRRAEGEEVLGHVVLNNQPPTGTILPPVQRNRRLPPDSLLPLQVQKLLPPRNGEDLKVREPKLRLLCMYGAGDSVVQEWCHMQHEAPSYIEMVTHELPGHGVRSDERAKTTLQEVADDAFEAFREAMDTGHFAVIGHSIGCLIATALCERAKRELNVDPVLAIMLERAPPNLAVHSDYGLELLKSEPLEFLKIYNKQIAKGIESYKAIDKDNTGEHWKHMLDMWGNDLQIENDNREVGWYTFPCPILAFASPVVRVKDATQEQLDSVEGFFKIRTARDYVGHFAPECFEEWKQWTSHPEGATVVPIDADHFGIKKNERCRRRIWDALDKIVSRF